MAQTIAEMYIEKGEKAGELKRARTILLRQMRKRFKKVPPKVEARITATSNMQDLEGWLDRIVDAKTLADMGILVE